MGRWGSIKYKKAASDAKRGVAMAKASRDVMAAARSGGGDIAFNMRLRTAVDRAKAAGLPMSKIENAIEKGLGAGSGDAAEDLTYEGYGPGGVAIFIEASTDNRNRTAGDIRSYFNKYEGNLGQDGSVAYLFETTGLIQVSLIENSKTFEALFELAAEAGATDVQPSEEEADTVNIYCEATELNTVSRNLEEAGLSLQSAEVTRLCTTEVAITDPELAKPLLKLLQAIDEHDDVQRVYSNAHFADGLLEEA